MIVIRTMINIFCQTLEPSKKIQYFWVSNEFVFVASKYSVRPQAMTLEYLFYCKDVAAAAYTGSSWCFLPEVMIRSCLDHSSTSKCSNTQVGCFVYRISDDV